MPFIQSWFDGVGFLHHGLCPGVLLLVVLLEFLDWQGRKSEIGVCPGIMASYLFEHQPSGPDRSSLRGKGARPAAIRSALRKRGHNASRALCSRSLWQGQ